MFLEAIISKVASTAVGGLISSLTKPFEMYLNKQITEAELRNKLALAQTEAETELRKALIQGFVETEKAHADSVTKTQSAFFDAMGKNDTMVQVWKIGVFVELFVLFWHQWCIPFIVMVVRNFSDNSTWNYPSSGATVEWAYLLLAAWMGAGAVLLRSGPAAGNIADQIKGLVLKK